MMMLSMNRFGDSLGSHLDNDEKALGLIGVWVNECRSTGTVLIESTDPVGASGRQGVHALAP